MVNVKGLQGIKGRYRAFVCPLVKIIEQIPVGSRMFDVGCGSGTLLHLGQQFRRTEKADGYDIAPVAVEAAKSFDSINVRLLSIDDPIPSFSNYDVVTMVDVLHHVPVDVQSKFLEEIIINMDSGSELLIADINAEKRVGAFLNQLHDLILAKEWVHPLTLEKIEAVISKCDCEIVHQSLHRTLWYPHFIMKVKVLKHE